MLICGIERQNWFNDIELYIVARYSVAKIKFQQRFPNRIRNVLCYSKNIYEIAIYKYCNFRAFVPIFVRWLGKGRKP